MTQGGKLTPNLDEGSTKILNLRVLQRIDPFIEEILITAAHVTFYEFNIALSEWSRKDVEGSLFVVKRNSQPRFQFIVMNRRNTDNLVENLLGDFEYEIQVPYLLYRNAAQEVTGIWFYNSRECEDVANLFSRILNAYSKVPPKPSVSSTKSEFEELEPATATPVMEGSLEPSSIAVSNVSDVPDESRIASLFSGARIFENASNAVIPRQFYQPSAPVALSSLAPNAMHSPMPTIQLPSAPVPTSSIPPISFFDNSGTSSSNRAANLVKPSVFSAPSASSALLMPSISSAVPTAVTHPPVNMQRQHGAPFLQPFPPPNPSSALTPGPLSASNSGTFFTRDKVRDALLRLAQNNQFIDMFYQELMNTHN